MIAKRLFDLLVTLLALVGFSPVIIYVYLKVKKEFGLPVIFSQQRPGLGGKPFKDELPELWNVLLGHMSLVGPRPLLMDYLPLYSPEQARRHNVRPGITGWAQVNGRNAISWEEKFSLDVWYVDNRSMWLDIKILYLTIIRVVRKDNINADGDTTMPAFRGNSSTPDSSGPNT